MRRRSHRYQRENLSLNNRKQSLQCGHFYSSEVFPVEFLVLKASVVQSMLLHLEMVSGADCVDVGSGEQSLELLLRIVHFEDFLNAVEMVADVVAVLVDLECSLD